MMSAHGAKPNELRCDFYMKAASVVGGSRGAGAETGSGAAACAPALRWSTSAWCAAALASIRLA